MGPLCIQTYFLCQQLAPEIPRIWKAAIGCRSCGYPNDYDCSFCQRCGSQKQPLSIQQAPEIVQIDFGKVNERLQALTARHKKKPYQKQKCSLQNQLESYLWSLPCKKSLATASPSDVANFLIWRDQFGKTKVHLEDCCISGKSSRGSCHCHVRLTAGTINSNIGKLRSIFKENGRGPSWNDELHLGNPAAHSSVKQYHTMVLEEQAIARSFPVQAVPMFLDKLQPLCSHLHRLIKSPEAKPISVYIYARDLAFFSVDFFSGDRGSDLGRVKSMDILASSNNDGFIFNQVFGKTLRGNGSNVFAIQKIEDSPVCPVTNLRLYLSLCHRMSINLEGGYLFRTTDRQGRVSTTPYVGTAVEKNLKKYLEALDISDGETMHSFRSGCSITLALLGVPYSKIANHVGWKSTNMAKYYTQCDKVFATDSPSSILSNYAHPSSSTSEDHFGTLFRSKNTLEGFKPLFQ